MAKSLTEMAAEIAVAQASHGKMSGEEIQDFLKKTYSALKEIKEAEDTGEVSPEEKDELTQFRESPLKSIQRNYIVNLEDGKKYKVLTGRTLAKCGLTSKEYRKKWGLPARQPLSAKSLSAKRRKKAMELGLGERLQKARKARAKKK